MKTINRIEECEARGVYFPIGKFKIGTRKKVGHGLGCRRIDHGALVHGRKKARREAPFLVVRQPLRIGQYHKGGQVIGNVSQGVRNPRPHTGKAREKKARVHHVGAGAVHIGLGGHGHEEGHLIDQLGLLGKHLTDPATALTVLLKGEGTLHQGTGRGRKAVGLFFGSQHLPMEPLELGLVVEEIHGARAARHKELDNPIDARRMMEGRLGLGFPREQLRQGQARETAAHIHEKIAPIEEGLLRIVAH